MVFTLSNTNISERERERATIKVLGFRRGEVHRYINKETIVLTLIGIVAGWPLGYVITRFLTYVPCHDQGARLQAWRGASLYQQGDDRPHAYRHRGWLAARLRDHEIPHVCAAHAVAVLRHDCGAADVPVRLGDVVRLYFTLIINRMTNRSLDRIDMVGALKSAE